MAARIFSRRTRRRSSARWRCAVLDERAAPDAAGTPQRGARWGRSRTFATTIYERVVAKLRREPTEDFRLDFEDGYGNREDAEEDGHADSSADQVAAGLAEGTLPPFIGIRVKPFNEDLRARSMRTLDIFIRRRRSPEATGGKSLMNSRSSRFRK